MIQDALGLGGMVKGNIDKSVAGSLFADEKATRNLKEQVKFLSDIGSNENICGAVCVRVFFLRRSPSKVKPKAKRGSLLLYFLCVVGMIGQVVKMYPALKDSKDSLEFGCVHFLRKLWLPTNTSDLCREQSSVFSLFLSFLSSRFQCCRYKIEYDALVEKQEVIISLFICFVAGRRVTISVSIVASDYHFDARHEGWPTGKAQKLL